MLVNIISGFLVALVLSAGAVSWRNRHHLSFVPVALRPWITVRVSVSALLRIKDDDCYVAFHTPYTPGSFGPPGGVCKYAASAEPALEKMGFRAQRVPEHGDRVRRDLRGFVSSRRLLTFARWLRSGVDRESGPQCLRRELSEELREVGHPELIIDLNGIDFALVRRAIDGPVRVPSRNYRQVRFHEVYDLVTNNAAAVNLRTELLRLGKGGDAAVICISGDDISGGRSGQHLLGSQTSFLIGDRKIGHDLPPLK